MENWVPILEGKISSQARAAIDAIAQDLAVSRSPTTGLETCYPFSLAFGTTGIGIFFYYLWLADQNKNSAKVAKGFLAGAVEALSVHQMPVDLFCGFAGVVWACEHSKEMLWPDADIEDSCIQIDAALQRWCEVRDIPVELLHGCAGLCVYAAERSGQKSAAQLLQKATERIIDDSDVLPEGAAWRVSTSIASQYEAANLGDSQRIRELFVKGVYKVSVAHGAAGVVGALHSTGLVGKDNRVSSIVESAVQWILSKRRSGDLPQEFPEMVGAEFRQLTTGWCNGDLGIGIVLFNIARSLRNADWRNQALEILAAESRRSASEIEEFNQRNYNLCHGSAGRAHVFNRLYQQTGDSIFLRAAIYWIDHALALREPGKGVGGFLVHEPNNGGTKAVSGLLMGAAGLGLVLLAAVSHVEPRWDRALLISPVKPQGNSIK